MRSSSRSVRALVVCTLLTLVTIAMSAAISIPTALPTSQAFDGMGIPATASTPSTLPADFRVDTLTSVRTVGTFASAATSAARAGGASLSASASNGAYNFGAGTTPLGGSDRAIGFLSSGSATQSGNLYAQLLKEATR